MHHDVVHSSWLSLCFLTLLAVLACYVYTIMHAHAKRMALFALPGNLCAAGDRR